MACFAKRLGEALGLAFGLLIVLALGLTTRSAVGSARFVPIGAHAATVVPPFTITLEHVAAGLSAPVAIANAADGSGRLFVLEQAGRVRVVEHGSVLSTPYLSLTSQVACCGERGLLGLAFDPDFAANGAFYLNYTTNAAGHFGATVIARYQVSDPAADVATVLTATRILTIEQPEPNHNGGDLHFGPNDGYLYIGMGDGGGGGDQHGPIGNGQNPAVLLGKMLRLNVRGVPTYTIPPSNPFTQTVGYLPEIWATGLRNPWRFSFDRETGDLYLGDVGQNCWEEIDYQPASSRGGENYGWRIMEGFRPFNVSNFFDCFQAPITPPTLTLPITTYSRSPGNAVSGGTVYRGLDFPWLNGLYFYADYGSGRMWAAAQTSPGVWWSAQQHDAPFSISAFGEDEDGELYLANYSGGEIYRLISASPINLSSSTKQVSSLNAAPGEVLTYTIVLRNTGLPFSHTVRVTDVVPGGLAYISGTFTATSGVPDAAAAPALKWTGVLSPTPVVTLTYVVTVSASTTQAITNYAVIAPGYTTPFTRSATIVLNGWSIYLPVVLKN